jgi:hypothetical protein
MSGSCGWFPIPRAEIDAWVEAHRDSLPTSLAALSVFPIPFRKAIVATLPSEVVAGMWREHLLASLGSAAKRSPEQDELINGAVEAIDIVFGKSDAAQESLHALNDRIRQLVVQEVISRQQAREIFATLGPPEPPGGLPLPPGKWSIDQA